MFDKDNIEVRWASDSERLKIRQNIKKQVVNIEGINYSFDLFRGFGIGRSGLALNEPFQIIRREDGVIAIKKIKKTGRVK